MRLWEVTVILFVRDGREFVDFLIRLIIETRLEAILIQVEI